VLMLQFLVPMLKLGVGEYVAVTDVDVNVRCW
jgi:hypothetical protein